MNHATIRPAGTKNYIKFRKSAVAEYMKRSAIRLGTPVYKRPKPAGGGGNPFNNKPRN